MILLQFSTMLILKDEFAECYTKKVLGDTLMNKGKKIIRSKGK